MVLAGVRGVASPGRESGPTEGVICCGHFAVSGVAVGDHLGGADPWRIPEGRPRRRRRAVRLLPGLDRHGRRHPAVPQLDSGDHQLDPVLGSVSAASGVPGVARKSTGTLVRHRRTVRSGGTYGMALRETDPAEVGGYRIEDRLGSGGMRWSTWPAPPPAAASPSRWPRRGPARHPSRGDGRPGPETGQCRDGAVRPRSTPTTARSAGSARTPTMTTRCACAATPSETGAWSVGSESATTWTRSPAPASPPRSGHRPCPLDPPPPLTSTWRPPVLAGDALYVPYGIPSVYTVDVRNL